jgi:deoxyribodipyrimidine photolyase-related protein
MHLILVLGDQLDPHSAAFDGFDARADAVWMAEVAHESAKVWAAKPRVALFVSAMRHFRKALQGRGLTVAYHEMGAHATFADALRASVKALEPERVVMVRAGEWGVQQEIERTAVALKVPLDVR